MDRRDKFKVALYRDYEKGAVMRYSDIVKCVQKYFPEVEKDSILPSDFCCNHKNQDPFSGKHHLFERVGYGRYKLL